MNRGQIKHWNPARPVIPGIAGKLLPIRRRVNNFGDLLGPAVVQRVLARSAVAPDARPRNDLLTVGSILHFAETGDTVWGSGVNGKVDPAAHRFEGLDVRAVRGPLTRAFLQERGITTPAVFGDPGLLVRELWPDDELDEPSAGVPEVAIIPNLNDYASFDRTDKRLVDPRLPLRSILSRIRHSELVVASSLHGLIVADSFGIPFVFVRPRAESIFKYEDYSLGTGRDSMTAHDSVESALRASPAPPSNWTSSALLRAFPLDLWTANDAASHEKGAK